MDTPSFSTKPVKLIKILDPEVSYLFSILPWYKQLEKTIKTKCLHPLNEGLGAHYNPASADLNFRDLELEFIYTSVNLKAASVGW